MFSLNRVSVIGYQTQPIDLRKTPGGASVADLNLVVPFSFKSESGQALTGRTFFTVTVWGSMADFASQFVHAGSQVFIAGRLQTDSWEDQTTKEKRSKTKMVALDMILLDPKDGQGPAPENAPHLMNALNRADLVGNVTRDPEMRTTTGGQKVLTLGIATNERWKEKSTGEDKERAEFHNVVVWGDLADEVSHAVHKGSRVFVMGRVQNRSWETQAGQKRTTTEIVADQVSLLGIANPAIAESIDASGTRRAMPRSAAPSASAGAAPAQSPAAAIPEIQYSSEIKVEDLPF